MSRLIFTIHNASLVAGRSKPILLDLIQAIRIEHRGIPIKWLDLLSKAPNKLNSNFIEAYNGGNVDENISLVRDGLPPLPPAHTYKSTSVLVTRTLNQSRIILKTATEKMKLEKNLRRLLQMSHSGHTRVCSTRDTNSYLNTIGTNNSNNLSIKPNVFLPSPR